MIIVGFLSLGHSLHRFIFYLMNKQLNYEPFYFIDLMIFILIGSLLSYYSQQGLDWKLSKKF